MRFGLIADVHADPRGLERALRWLDSYDVDEVICAGDLVGYGSQADAAVAIVRDRGIPCVRGNHDRWALERRQVLGLRGWKPADFRDETWEFLASVPTRVHRDWQGHSVTVCHGSPESDTEFVSPYKEIPESVHRFWDEAENSVLVLGHTHIPMIERSLRGTIINPGSILAVPGVQTSCSFAVVDGDDLSVQLFDILSGREIRRDPVFESIA